MTDSKDVRRPETDRSYKPDCVAGPRHRDVSDAPVDQLEVAVTRQQQKIEDAKMEREIFDEVVDAMIREARRVGII